MVSYEGIFFEGNEALLIHSLEKPRLDNINDEIHCTFKYHPSDDEIFNEIVGQEFTVYLVGYANNGINSSFQLVFPKELEKYYINYDEEKKDKLKIPHITASLATGAKASNTKNLLFKPLEKPIKLVGKFGFWIKEENGSYLSYEPYTHSKNR